MNAAPHFARGDEHAAATEVPDFDGLAGVYRWMEYASFGPWLWWCRCAFLPKLRECRRALILGDGDGRFTARLLATNASIQVDAVDVSASMLRSLLRRAGLHANRVFVHCADACNWRPDSLPPSSLSPGSPHYDLIVTHFFLDCLTTREVRHLVDRLSGSVAPGALWLVSEFAVPQSWFGRVIARPFVAMLYRIFGILTGLKVRKLPDYSAALRDASFRLAQQRAWLGGLLVSELWSKSREI
jgi:Methyltransferase domain